MPRHLLERLVGIGSIYSGEQLLRTTAYQLSVWTDGEPPSEPAQAADLTIDGSIDITGIGEAVVLAGAEALTLRLEDGRSLPFELTGSGGGIVGRGGLRPMH